VGENFWEELPRISQPNSFFLPFFLLWACISTCGEKVEVELSRGDFQQEKSSMAGFSLWKRF